MGAAKPLRERRRFLGRLLRLNGTLSISGGGEGGRTSGTVGTRGRRGGDKEPGGGGREDCGGGRKECTAPSMLPGGADIRNYSAHRRRVTCGGWYILEERR